MAQTFNELLPILQHASSRWVPGGMIVNEVNEPAVRSALAWASGHPSFAGDTGKGLLLMGHKGSGKTLLMRSLGACFTGTPLYFTIHNTRKITSAYNTDGDAGLRPYLAQVHMLFDDLGDERMGQHYGDKVEVMSLVIQERYELFVDHGIMSHFTTNLTGDEIRERYGDRVHSRLLHMVNSFRVGEEENATDWRAIAKAPERHERAEITERVPASPEVAKEGFAKAYAAINETKRALTIGKSVAMHAVPTQEDDLKTYAEALKGKSFDQLSQLRTDVDKNYLPHIAAPYLQIIDEAIEAKTETA